MNKPTDLRTNVPSSPHRAVDSHPHHETNKGNDADAEDSLQSAKALYNVLSTTTIKDDSTASNTTMPSKDSLVCLHQKQHITTTTTTTTTAASQVALLPSPCVNSNNSRSGLRKPERQRSEGSSTTCAASCCSSSIGSGGSDDVPTKPYQQDHDDDNNRPISPGLAFQHQLLDDLLSDLEDGLEIHRHGSGSFDISRKQQQQQHEGTAKDTVVRLQLRPDGQALVLSMLVHQVMLPPKEEPTKPSSSPSLSSTASLSSSSSSLSTSSPSLSSSSSLSQRPRRRPRRRTSIYSLMTKMMKINTLLNQNDDLFTNNNNNNNNNTSSSSSLDMTSLSIHQDETTTSPPPPPPQVVSRLQCQCRRQVGFLSSQFWFWQTIPLSCLSTPSWDATPSASVMAAATSPLTTQRANLLLLFQDFCQTGKTIRQEFV